MQLEVVRSRGRTLRRQLERQIRDAIRSGRLRAGSRLPPSRVLAGELGVSRGVVTDVYGQLAAEGYLRGRRGSGTKVSRLSVPAGSPSSQIDLQVPSIEFDLRPGQSDFSSFPRRQWQAEVARALRDLPDRALTYPDPLGLQILRVAIADYVNRVRGAVATSEDVVICPSTTYGISSIWHALRQLGARRVGVENPGWRWQARTVEQAGLQPVPITVDTQGLLVEQLDAAKVDAVAVTPAHQFPTGVVMSPERRAALVEWARRRHATIVEDDYDAEFRYERQPVAALQGLAPDIVAFCATTSKTLAPALRIAWMVVHPGLRSNLAGQYANTWPGPSAIDQHAAATFIQRGELDRHIRRTRTRYRLRRDTLISALADYAPELRIGGVAAGLHLIAWLPEDLDDVSVAEAARKNGVAVHALHRHCFSTHDVSPALVLGYARLTEPQLRRAGAVLGQVLKSQIGRGARDLNPGPHAPEL